MRNIGRDAGASLAEIETIYRRDFPAFARTAGAILGDAEACPRRGAGRVCDCGAPPRRLPRRGSLEGWLWRIVVNAARAQRRARPAGGLTTSDYEGASASSNGRVSDSESGRVRQVLAELPERQRLVVFLRYFADLEHARIAEALGIRPGTVAATLNAAHAALRRRLEEVTP